MKQTYDNYYKKNWRSLRLDIKTFQKIKNLAEKEGVKMVELIRKLIKGR